ncbi:EF-P beta-lysylation protein EpmB [Gammaproteobacteria bacterium]|nr:EF-P beta-lysylation protein EpmB [Gammaproteobacteria bacterium]
MKKIWQTALIECVTDAKELVELLDLNDNLIEEIEKSSKLFQLKIPRCLISRIEKGNINDPILKQVLPLGIEQVKTNGYTTDPLNEKKYNPVPGLLHKYHGRVLLTLTGVCSINCRYCFRRHFPYSENNPNKQSWDNILNYLATDMSITEVIFSGGDPLILNDTLLQNLIQKLENIPHLKRLRIHSRMPIILPERITNDLMSLLDNSRFNTVLVTHCNHPNEINLNVENSINKLKKIDLTLLNQAVLLKGVNDDAETLINLSEKLFKMNILPYYLHLLDKVEGAAHFNIDTKIAQQLHWEMTKKLPGYLVPKLVIEKSGAPAKLQVANFEFYTG